MSNSARSIFVFGLYLLALGIILIAAPNFLLGMFFIPSTTEVWIRVLGVVVLYLGFYYTQAARNEMTDFFQWTVYLRPTLILFFSTFVILGFVGPTLIRFAGSHLDWLGITIHKKRLSKSRDHVHFTHLISNHRLGLTPRPALAPG
jgi:hypothetical protein